MNPNTSGEKIRRVVRFIQKSGFIRSKYMSGFCSRTSREYVCFNRVRIDKIYHNKLNIGDVITDDGVVKIYQTKGEPIPIIVLCEVTCGLWCHPGFVICTPEGCCVIPKGAIAITRSR